MSLKNFKFATLFITVVVSILSCNSNAQPVNNFTGNVEPMPEPTPTTAISYRASGKQSTQANYLTLATSFQNDYYTNNQNSGSFYAELKADEFKNDNYKKVPLNISVVIDRSGSMSGEKIQRAKEAAKYIVDQLSENDYLSIVSYDQKVEVVVSANKATNKSAIKSAINGITDRGSTNLCGGAVEGYNQVKKHYNSNYINRVVLLSDGLANEGITDPKQIEKIVKNQLYQNGITLSSFGIGRDYNEDLMTAMAETGNGNYYFIDNANDIAGMFQKELKGLSQVVAQNVQLKITIPEYVNIEKVYGGKYEQNGRVLTMDLRDVFSQDTKAILIKYRINNNTNATVVFNSTLVYKAIDANKNSILTTKNKQEFTTNNNTYSQHFSEWVMAQDVLFSSNEKLEEAMREVDNGNYDKARKISADNDQYLKSNAPMVSKSVELQRASTANTVYQDIIMNAESMDMETKKVLQKSSKSLNYQIRGKK